MSVLASAAAPIDISEASGSGGGGNVARLLHDARLGPDIPYVSLVDEDESGRIEFSNTLDTAIEID